MTPLSVPVAMLAAVALQVGLYHLWLYVQRRRRSDLFFSATCAGMTVYTTAAFFLYNVDDAEAGALWQRIQIVSLTTLTLTFALLAKEYSGAKPPKAVFWVLALYPVFAFATAFDTSGTFYTSEPMLRHVSTPLGAITYHEIRFGPWFVLLELIIPLLLFYFGYLAVGGWQRSNSETGDRKASITLLATTALMMAGIVHDELAHRQILQHIYLVEYTFIGVIAVMNWALSREVLESSDVKRTLAATEHRISTTMNAIQDAVITTDTSGCIAHLNRAAERLLAIRADDVTGAPLTHYMEITSQETHSIVTDPVRFAVGRPSNPYGELPQLVTTDGNERRVDLGGAPLRNPDGKVLGAVVVIRDLTIQHSAIEQLEHATQMESMGRLAGGVAHDLNNLLTPILSYAELLERDAKEGSNERLFLDYILDAAQKAAGVTKQLLAVSRKQVLDVQVISLSALVEQTTPLLRQITGEDVELDLHLDSEAGNVQVDPAQFEQVILNLASNACDAMPHGGRLIVHVRRITGEEVSLEVRDTGTGMLPETVERIFEPFFTTKPRGKGTGLGLASVRGIVEQHGGTIYVDSEPDEGSSFEIVLPVSAGDVSESDSRSLPPEEAMRGQESLLVVEDDRSVRTLIHDALSQLGYSVHVADGLATAEAVADSESLDLLVTDVVMPGADGPRVYQAVRRRQNVPCLYITGHADDRLGDRGFVSQGTEVLRKPFTVTQLAERVRQVLDTSAKKTN